MFRERDCAEFLIAVTDRVAETGAVGTIRGVDDSVLCVVQRIVANVILLRVRWT